MSWVPLQPALGQIVDFTLTSGCHRGGDLAVQVHVRLLLIPISAGLPAIQDALERVPAGRPITVEEMRRLSQLLLRSLEVSELLIVYAKAVGGIPHRC